MLLVRMNNMQFQYSSLQVMIDHAKRLSELSPTQDHVRQMTVAIRYGVGLCARVKQVCVII